MEEIPHSWTLIGDRYVSPYVAQAISQPPGKLAITSDQTNIDRIADQMKKHAAINYSYYTRTKWKGVTHLLVSFTKQRGRQKRTLFLFVEDARWKLFLSANRENIGSN